MKQDGIVLDPSEDVEKYSSGIISSGKSLKKQTVANFEIPPKTSVYFSEDGKLFRLWADGNLQIGNLVFSNSYQVELYPNRSVKSGILTAIHTINGIEYCGLVQERKYHRTDSSWTPFITYFYENATVQKGFLAKNTIINDFNFMAETEIEFYPDGKILYGKSASKQEYKGHQIYEDDRVYFHKNGMVSEVYNEWGMGRFDENGMHMGHKQYLK